MDPSAARYLEALTAEVAAVVGGRLVGVYPHGSLMLGGYRPERSDIDVLVVVDEPLSSDEQAALAARLSEDALPCPAIGLELSVVTRAVAAAPTARPAFELHVTTAPQGRKVVDGHGHPGDLDLVLHFAVCHALGHSVIAPVPRDLVLTQLADELDWALEHAGGEYAVLNACRAWRYAVDGALVSKVAGGEWALTQLDAGGARGLVQAATARQTGTDPTARLHASGIRTFVLACRDVVRRGRPGDQNV